MVNMKHALVEFGEVFHAVNESSIKAVIVLNLLIILNRFSCHSMS